MRSVHVNGKNGLRAEVIVMNGKIEVAVFRDVAGFAHPVACWNVERNVDAPRSGRRTKRVSYFGKPREIGGIAADSRHAFSTMPHATLSDVGACALEIFASCESADASAKWKRERCDLTIDEIAASVTRYGDVCASVIASLRDGSISKTGAFKRLHELATIHAADVRRMSSHGIDVAMLAAKTGGAS